MILRLNRKAILILALVTLLIILLSMHFLNTLDDHYSSSEATVLSDVKGTFMSSSSVYCTGHDRTSRVCRFENLCYDGRRDSWIFLRGPRSKISGNFPPPGDEERSTSKLLETSSIANHNVFFWDYVEVDGSEFWEMEKDHIEMVERKTFAFSRFLPYNIMHMFHDDVLGIAATIQEFQDDIADSENWLGSLDHNLLFLESNGKSTNKDIYGTLTSNPFLQLDEFRGRDPVCFKDIVVGISKRLTWYQYGFFSPQGPIPKKRINGLEIRQLAGYILKSLLMTTSEHVEPAPKDDYIVIFSRTKDRLIINEKELALRLESEFGMKTYFLRLEEMSLRSIINFVSKAKVAIGMHGSLLILSIFLPTGSILMELYPFAVPAENYTPYRTLCSIPGMNLVYRSWSNNHEENNVMHPDRDSSKGGINHLSHELQQKIIATPTVPLHTCCSDPYWLFRIYQDTKINSEEIILLLEDALVESEKTIKRHIQTSEIVPAMVEDVTCSWQKQQDSVYITWKKPFNTKSSSIKYEVWVHEKFKAFYSSKEEFSVSCSDSKPSIQIYVRAISKHFNTTVGPYSPVKVCACH